MVSEASTVMAISFTPYSERSEIRGFVNYMYEKRGFIHGYESDYKDFDKEPSADELRHRTQSLDDETYNRSNTFVTGLDGAALMYKGKLMNNYSLSYEQYNSDDQEDLDHSDRVIPDIGGKGHSAYSQRNQSVNLAYSLSSARASLVGRYRVSTRLYIDKQRTKNFKRVIELNDSRSLLDPGSIYMNFDYNLDSVDLELSVDGRLYLNPRSYVEGALLSRYYYRHLKQKSHVTTSGSGGLYWNLLNDRLRAVGLPGYSTDPDGYSATYQQYFFLPELEWAYEHRLSILSQHNYYLRYYASAQPGGINPYVLRTLSRKSYNYKPEFYHTFEAGMHGHYLAGILGASLRAFYIDMRDVQYIAARDALETYYGNNKGGNSYGLQSQILYRILPNLEWHLQGNYTIAKYKTFKYQIFSDRSSAHKIERDYSKKTIINTPKYMLSTYLAYTMNSGIYMRGEYRHFGPMYADYANQLKIKSHGQMNLALGWDNKHYAVELYVRNALDDRKPIAAEPSPYNETGEAVDSLCHSGICNTLKTDFRWQSVVVKSYQDPRAFGLMLGARY